MSDEQLTPQHWENEAHKLRHLGRTVLCPLRTKFTAGKCHLLSFLIRSRLLSPPVDCLPPSRKGSKWRLPTTSWLGEAEMMANRSDMSTQWKGWGPCKVDSYITITLFAATLTSCNLGEGETFLKFHAGSPKSILLGPSHEGIGKGQELSLPIASGSHFQLGKHSSFPRRKWQLATRPAAMWKSFPAWKLMAQINSCRPLAMKL